MDKFITVLLILLAICVTAYAMYSEKIVQQDNPLNKKLFLSPVPPDFYTGDDQEESCADLIKKCEEINRFCR